MKRTLPMDAAPTDLAVEAFKVLRAKFLNASREPIAYVRPLKGGTQGDPLDTLISSMLAASIPDAACVKSGNNTSPDIALFRADLCNGVAAVSLEDACERIIAIEVKKLKRDASGAISRDTGSDFNSTPPCGKVRVYDRRKRPFDVRGFHLFIDEAEDETDGAITYRIGTILLCDGNVLNDDFEYYKSFLTPLSKAEKQGSYGDGAVRQRRMAIFPNPLSCASFTGRAVLIHRSPDLTTANPDLVKTHILRRTRPGGGLVEFSCYQFKLDVVSPVTVEILTDPFSRAKKPRDGTRGKFKLELSPETTAPPEPDTEDSAVDDGEVVAPPRPVPKRAAAKRKPKGPSE